MDRRFWSFCLFVVVSSTSTGCSLFSKKTVLPNLPAAPVSAHNPRSVSIMEPIETETVKKDGPLEPKTLIVYANTCVEVVARDPAKPPAERERLLTIAKNNYNEVLKKDPNNLDALMGLGSVYQVTGEGEKLAEIEARTIKAHPKDGRVWSWIAIRQGKAKEWDQAAESFLKASQCDPDNRMYRIQLGFTLARARRYDEGFEWLRRSMRTHEAHFNIAQMAAHNGDNGRASDELRKCLSLEPTYQHAQQMLTQLNSPEYLNIQPVSGQNHPAVGGQAVRPAYHNEPQPLITHGRLNGAPLMPEYHPTTGWDSSGQIRR